VKDSALIARYGSARRDRALALLEGFHALKHAMRFGAQLVEVVCSNPRELERLADEFAPELAARMLELAREIPQELFSKLVPLPPPTHVVALAERPAIDVSALLADGRAAPVVLLEDPRDLGNVGACIRVSAAADAAGVLTTGDQDPWHPDALRGSAGLHYALPVANVGRLEALRSGPPARARSGMPARVRPLLALDPEGEPLAAAALPARALLAFGSERRGLSAELLASAHARVSIPMRAGVSSLNLATSVSAVLFSSRLSAGSRPLGASEA
jgi:TrmH family RNA methyltransferase